MDEQAINTGHPGPSTSADATELLRQELELTRQVLHAGADASGACDHVAVENIVLQREAAAGIFETSIDALPCERRVAALAVYAGS